MLNSLSIRDVVLIERLDLQGCDGDEARLERAELTLSDLRTSQWKGALWHRVRAKDCDFTGLDFSGAQLLRCELGPVRMERVCFHRARIQDTKFVESELYSADFAGAVLLKVTFAPNASVPPAARFRLTPPSATLAL